MTQFGITLGYETDTCSICKNKKEIRHVYKKDKENSQMAKVCDECVSKHPELTIEKMIEKYGEKTTEKHIEILTKEQMKKSGFEIESTKKELKKKIENKTDAA